MGKRIVKKTWPDLFELILSGDKNFDLRLRDEVYNIGDILVLKEWDPKTKKYTGRKIEKKITFVLSSNEINKFWSKEEIDKHGFQIVSFK